MTSREVVVNLIANTTTSKGLEILVKLDDSKYETGIKVTDEEFKSIILEKDDFRGEWNHKSNQDSQFNCSCYIF